MAAMIAMRVTVLQTNLSGDVGKGAQEGDYRPWTCQRIC
jgi:hypothetical protein